MRTSINRRNRTACSILALATALAVGPSPAAAQSFQYQPNPTVLGSAVITNPDASTTQIVVNNPQTVITWTPTDTATSTSPIVFQPGGTTANFVGGSNFAVLNRIIATDQTRQIQFFGTVNSYIGAVGGNTGGSIYFYAPGGFLLGGGSVFNVGSLVLSASPILHDANGTFITGARNEVTFGQATQLGATITTNPGSQINALGNPSANTFSNSYVAFVAPRIIRGGDIAVNGQAAMVAADAATIRFAPDGLFDIEVTSGTAQANGITGGGDITGPASSGSGDNHRVYMVAVPKNQALSLALSQGSDLGFNIANAADVVGNAIVLSAGHDIVNGQVQSARSAGGGTGAASIIANAVNATSAVTAQATGNGQFFSSAGQSSNFASNLTLIAPEFAWASASGSDASFNVVGDITLNSDVFGSVEGASATGGWASLYAQNGGFVSIGGNATLSANGFGAGSSGNGVSAGSGTGGRAWIQAEPGSSMFITGAANATADGYGGFASGAGAAGGTGTGGEALIRAFGAGSSLGIDGNATASAHGYGGGAFNGDGGLGSGGDAGIYADIGSLTVDGSLLAITSAYGGDGGGAGNSSGDGVGGDSYVYANAGGALTVAGQLQVASHAFGGVDTSGLAASGAGLAGNSTLYAFGGGDVSSGSMASVQANGYGGPFGECIGCGGAAAIGRGGSAEISTSGAGSTLTLAGVSIAANGTGSNGVVDQGGDGYGGYAEMWANSGGSITVNGSASLTATGTGGADFGGFGGGDGFGGGYLGDGYAQIATYGTDNATSITVTGSTLLQANGNGGAATQVAGAAGGNGRAGVASVTSNIGSIALNSVSVSAVGNGGNSNAGTGGSGTGGEAYLFASGGNLTVSTTALVSTGGSGGSGGTGGAGTGGGNLAGQFGGAGLFASGAGLLTINGAATVQALGTGGVGTAAGGAALGGVAQANAFSGGDIDLLGLTRISSDATAGAGADGRGGVSIARATSGSTIDFNQLNLRADGRGGNDSGAGTGDGYGGTAILSATGTGASITVANTITSGPLQDQELASADGFGGTTNGGGDRTGGTGTGGTTSLSALSGGFVSLVPTASGTNFIYLRARGYGGGANANNTTAGAATGGTMNLVVDGGTMTT
ncbi:MAG TPA: hypothetical protein VFO42_06805, partial [Sphingomicrobium sp.]|nr:hypothetical protein [Sphingomicrobium sp.]